MATLRVLVTGSRTFDKPEMVCGALDALLAQADTLTVVHGTAKGADMAADEWGRKHRDRVRLERHPAQWSRYGRRAGMLRNAEMVKLGADVVVAFWRDGSIGTSRTIDLAEEAGIPVTVVHYEGGVSFR